MNDIKNKKTKEIGKIINNNNLVLDENAQLCFVVKTDDGDVQLWKYNMVTILQNIML